MQNKLFTPRAMFKRSILMKRGECLTFWNIQQHLSRPDKSEGSGVETREGRVNELFAHKYRENPLFRQISHPRNFY